MQLGPQPWSPERLPLWPPAARRRARALMLMLRRGRFLRARPEDDPHDHYAHALPTEVEWDVLGAVGWTWLLGGGVQAPGDSSSSDSDSY